MRDWKKAEHAVGKYFSEKKGSFIYRFSDTHDVNAQLGRFQDGKGLVYTEPKPSDFLIVENGITFFAEVKTTVNVKGTTAALFEQQKGMRNKIMRANGLYFYFVYSIVHKTWYKIPAFEITENPTQKWENFSNYKIDYLEVI